ncbi:hypothetical protein F7725_009931 [Dissostichus mawsoni]|uniref:SprT-like domain-containing protein n=1 Tax=Dissostichus mawsoni TaxID=36200 RepID=A0A7J5XMT5_DISMA|nr:hypothetical protein F7725_009931 [Dissostichus mawsoni]
MNNETRTLFERVAKKMGWDDEGGLDTAEKKLALCDSEDDPEKENQYSKGNDYRIKYLIESSDDDFDQFLVGRATPKAKPSSLNVCSAVKKDSSNVLVVSSDDDGGFETFLQRVKTPKAKPKKIAESGSEDSLKNFIVYNLSSDDDFIQPKSSVKVPKKSYTPAVFHPLRRPLSQWASPVFLSDSDDEENIVVKSTWKNRHSKPKSTPKADQKKSLRCDEDDSSPFLQNNKEPPVPAPSVKGFSTPVSKPLRETPLQTKTPGKPAILKPTVSQTEPRHGPTSRVALCRTPGCFLQTLSNPGSSYGRNFKQNKEELTSRLYLLYNSSVFDTKLPVNMSVTWNKKLRKTAGYCITGQERAGGNRYARIELSEKVCDSADRLRDTLIHEMCHSATWLINGVRDGHGNFWKLYARKSTVAHPELPMVTRCHSYDIKYKFQYQCTRCKNTIGRHSKSLDTQKFACALCTGQLVLLTSAKQRAPTPFANFVKENFGTVRQELMGQSHGEVMRKLSADFASTKLSQS